MTLLARVLLSVCLPAAAGTVARLPPAGPAAPYAPLAAPLLNLSPAAGVYERKGVGLLAVDVRDSTLLHQTIGNRKAHALTAAALDLAEATARDFDGTVVRRMGDGYLMVFPEAERAMRAAASLQETLPAWREKAGAPGLELRAAVHAGRVLVDARGKTPEAYGQSVERALALADKSLGGEVAMEPKLAEQFLADGWSGRAEHYRADGFSLLRLRGDPDGASPEVSPKPAVEVTRAATLFTSLVDWPAVFERHGRRRAYATVKAFHAYVEEIVVRHGGSVVKTTGDTVMATFPGTGAAVKAGLELQARLGDVKRASALGRFVAARVGISAGRVLKDGPDYFGNTVNAAARLMKRAKPGEVLVGAQAVKDDPEAAALMADAERTEASLKGFHHPIGVAGLIPRRQRADSANVTRLRAIADAAVAAVPPRE